MRGGSKLFERQVFVQMSVHQLDRAAYAAINETYAREFEFVSTAHVRVASEKMNKHLFDKR